MQSSIATNGCLRDFNNQFENMKWKIQYPASVTHVCMQLCEVKDLRTLTVLEDSHYDAATCLQQICSQKEKQPRFSLLLHSPKLTKSA